MAYRAKASAMSTAAGIQFCCQKPGSKVRVSGADDFSLGAEVFFGVDTGAGLDLLFAAMMIVQL
jgi:hypothetical protein